MDVRLINPFIRATQHVFEVMLARRAIAEQPCAAQMLPPKPHCVNAVIRMDGGATGAVLLRFPNGVILPVATALAGPGLSLEDAYDAIGEIANMITGNAKRDLSRHLVRISVPTIAIGDEALGDIARLKPWLHLPFSGPMGSFYLAVSISRIADPPTPDFSPNPSPPLSVHPILSGTGTNPNPC